MTATQALEFKQLLERRRAGIRAQIREKIRAVREQKRVLDASRSRTAFTDDVADDDVDLGIVRVQGQILARIKAALARLEAGEYGVCEECGREIADNRLRAVPFATRCRDCQETIERARRNGRPAASVFERLSFGRSHPRRR